MRKDLPNYRSTSLKINPDKAYAMNQTVSTAINRGSVLVFIEKRPVTSTSWIEIYKLDDMELIYRAQPNRKEWLLMIDKKFYILNKAIRVSLSHHRRKALRNALPEFLSDNQSTTFN